MRSGEMREMREMNTSLLPFDYGLITNDQMTNDPKFLDFEFVQPVFESYNELVALRRW
jgi:hypothetical protein